MQKNFRQRWRNKLTKLYYYEIEDYDINENKNYTTCGLVSGELTEVVSELSEFFGKELLSMKLVLLDEGPLVFDNEEVIHKFQKMEY